MQVAVLSATAGGVAYSKVLVSVALPPPLELVPCPALSQPLAHNTSDATTTSGRSHLRYRMSNPSPISRPQRAALTPSTSRPDIYRRFFCTIYPASKPVKPTSLVKVLQSAKRCGSNLIILYYIFSFASIICPCTHSKIKGSTYCRVAHDASFTSFV